MAAGVGERELWCFSVAGLKLVGPNPRPPTSPSFTRPCCKGARRMSPLGAGWNNYGSIHIALFSFCIYKW